MALIDMVDEKTLKALEDRLERAVERILLKHGVIVEAHIPEPLSAAAGAHMTIPTKYKCDQCGAPMSTDKERKLLCCTNCSFYKGDR